MLNVFTQIVIANVNPNCSSNFNSHLFCCLRQGIRIRRIRHMDVEEIRLLKVIQRIRDSFHGAELVYTNGSCVKFAMILKEIFPQGDILYDLSHAVFELNGRCYDITGLTTKTEFHQKIEEFGILHAYDSMNLKYDNHIIKQCL